MPEVSHYTEDVVFGGLDFPVGFDQSSLLINLRLINRVRAVAGLARVSNYASKGEDEAYDPSVSSVDRHGTATVGLAGKRQKKSIVHSLLR